MAIGKRLGVACVCLIVFSETVASGQSTPVSIGTPWYPDVIVTRQSNAGLVTTVATAEYVPADYVLAYPGFSETAMVPPSGDQVLSSIISELDGDNQTDVVQWVRHALDDRDTIEHWEIINGSLEFQSILVQGPPPPGAIMAVTVGDFDRDANRDILTIERISDISQEQLVHYEESPSAWSFVSNFPLGSPTDHHAGVSIGELDGDASLDVLVIRDDTTNNQSIIEHYRRVGIQLQYLGVLTSQPTSLHQFKSIKLGYLNAGTQPDLIVTDWFFYGTVHQIQWWEYNGAGIELRLILHQAIPPTESLLATDFSGFSPCTCFGDLNVNCVRNGRDVQQFVSCLLYDPIPGPLNRPCDCADINRDGASDLLDIGPFVSALVQSPIQACPAHCVPVP